MWLAAGHRVLNGQRTSSDDTGRLEMPYGDRQLFDESGISFGVATESARAGQARRPESTCSLTSRNSREGFRRNRWNDLGGSISKFLRDELLGNKHYALDAGKPSDAISVNGGDRVMGMGDASLGKIAIRACDFTIRGLNQNYVAWLNTLFPSLPGPLRDPSRADTASTKPNSPPHLAWRKRSLFPRACSGSNRSGSSTAASSCGARPNRLIRAGNARHRKTRISRCTHPHRGSRANR